MRRLVVILPLLCLIAAAVAYERVVAPKRAEALLKEVMEAPKRYNWEATIRSHRSFRRKSVEATVEVIHKKPDKDRFEYVAGDLKGLVVVNNSGHVTIVDEGMQGRASGMQGVPTPTSHRWGDLLRRNYRPRIAGSETVASRKAEILSLRPRSSDGESKRLWVDRETKVVVKSQTYDAAGNLIGESESEKIKFVKDVPDSVFIAVTGYGSRIPETTRPESLSGLKKRLGFTILQPVDLPPGYVFDQSFVYTCPCGCGMQSALLSYTDGANRLSIFETNVVHEDAESSFCSSADPEKRHRVSNYGSGLVVSATKDGIVCVVVGNLSKEALTRVADSIGSGAPPVPPR
jgi:outer membrane lipoprotein-sorting protein